MSNIERVGVSLERELLTVFNHLIAEDGYTCRSEAIRDLIRDRISRKRLSSSCCGKDVLESCVKKL